MVEYEKIWQNMDEILVEYWQKVGGIWVKYDWSMDDIWMEYFEKRYWKKWKIWDN